jgi:hypothetical protein
MHLDETIAETCLHPALPIRALLDTAGADEAVLVALEARRPDLVARIEARGEAAGRAEGEAVLRETIRLLCATLEVPVTKTRQRTLERFGLRALRDLAAEIARDRRWPRAR